MSQADRLPALAMLDRYGRSLEKIRDGVAGAESFEAAMSAIETGVFGARVQFESIQAEIKLRDNVLKTVLGG